MNSCFVITGAVFIWVVLILAPVVHLCGALP